MTDNQWKPGDIVRVKSGGPDMTVAGDDEIGEIMCQWFDGTNQKNGTFSPHVLEKATPSGFNKKIDGGSGSVA